MAPQYQGTDYTEDNKAFYWHPFQFGRRQPVSACLGSSLQCSTFSSNIIGIFHLICIHIPITPPLCINKGFAKYLSPNGIVPPPGQTCVCVCVCVEGVLNSPPLTSTNASHLEDHLCNSNVEAQSGPAPESEDISLANTTLALTLKAFSWHSHALNRFVTSNRRLAFKADKMHLYHTPKNYCQS